DYGGNDTITAGSGDDIIIAGEDGEAIVNDVITSVANITRTVIAHNLPGILDGGDTVSAGEGRNIVFGDNGRIIAARKDTSRFGHLPITLGRVETLESLIGGSDNITTGSGADIVLGGIDADVINAGDGNNIVIGDSGLVDWTAADRGGTLTGDD